MALTVRHNTASPTPRLPHNQLIDRHGQLSCLSSSLTVALAAAFTSPESPRYQVVVSPPPPFTRASIALVLRSGITTTFTLMVVVDVCGWWLIVLGWFHQKVILLLLNSIIITYFYFVLWRKTFEKVEPT